MNNIYLYADAHSRQVLLNGEQKIISIGGDFGHGNFGDIIQNVNSLNLAKKPGKFSAVSVMAASAIGFKNFPEWARNVYGADALIFISDYPLILDADSPQLEMVAEIRNIAAVQMYGGGFLNDMWGGFVLEVVEYFLRLSPQASYLVSGQQITAPFQQRVVRHIEAFRPRLFGVRDEISSQLLQNAGFTPAYSFDDATELLGSMARQLMLRKGPGSLMHLNVSAYTKNEADLSSMGDDFRRIAEKMGEGADLTLFQAFRDTRQDVLDTRESLKLLDQRFPFNDFREVDLAAFAYGAAGPASARPVTGEFGYSCSYHVALFLQLSGIPCWLRSSNTFYDQKSKALQVSQDFARFIEEPRLADHRGNLERRAQWLEAFDKAIADTPEVNHVSRVPGKEGGPAPWPFFFKGRPTLEEKLAMAQQETREVRLQAASDLSAQLAAVEDRARLRARRLRRQVEAYREQLTMVGCEMHLQGKRAAQRELERQREYEQAQEQAQEREQALQAQVAVAEAQAAQLLAAAREQSRQLAERMEQMLQSRSWRLTRPLRALARYAEHGHFDSRGQVGLYGLVQRLGRRLPVSPAMRSRIGRVLSAFRRQGGK